MGVLLREARSLEGPGSIEVPLHADHFAAAHRENRCLCAKAFERDAAPLAVTEPAKKHDDSIADVDHPLGLGLERAEQVQHVPHRRSHSLVPVVGTAAGKFGRREPLDRRITHFDDALDVASVEVLEPSADDLGVLRCH